MYQLMAELIEQNTPLSISQMCQALALSRADYYRWQSASEPLDSDLELRDQIQQIVLEMPGSLYRPFSGVGPPWDMNSLPYRVS